MHPGLSAEIKTQGKGGPAQRAWSTISSLLLPSAGPASLHCAFEQVTSSVSIGKPAAHSFHFIVYHVLIHLYLTPPLYYRYIHIIMVFWSFLAGVVTFYCSLGPESLLPNILVSIKPKIKVG